MFSAWIRLRTTLEHFTIISLGFFVLVVTNVIEKINLIITFISQFSSGTVGYIVQGLDHF